MSELEVLQGFRDALKTTIYQRPILPTYHALIILNDVAMTAAKLAASRSHTTLLLLGMTLLGDLVLSHLPQERKLASSAHSSTAYP